MTITEVYEKYKYLDRLMGNEGYMASDNFSGRIIFDLWDAVKSAVLTTGSTLTAAPVELAASHVDDGAAAGEP